jgi:hypothetical protein
MCQQDYGDRLDFPDKTVTPAPCTTNRDPTRRSDPARRSVGVLLYRRYCNPGKKKSAEFGPKRVVRSLSLGQRHSDALLRMSSSCLCLQLIRICRGLEPNPSLRFRLSNYPSGTTARALFIVGATTVRFRVMPTFTCGASGHVTTMCISLHIGPERSEG